MRILLVEDVLNGHSGTPKMFLNIAKALTKQGHQVKIIFFGESRDSSNIRPILDEFDYQVWKNKLLSLLEFPLRNYINKMNGNFRKDDVPSVLAQFLLFRKIKSAGFSPDLIIFSSPWAAFSSIISQTNKRSAVFVHEAPAFNDFNPVVGKILRLYFRALMKKTTIFSTTDKTMEGTSEFYGIKTKVLSHVVFEEIPIGEKKNFILLDTRWTNERDPFFAIELSKVLEGYPIVMHGFFPNENVKDKLSETIAEQRLNLKIVNGYSETELGQLYDNAKIIVRWSAKHETGTSYALMQGISHNCIPIVDSGLGSAGFISHNISPNLVVKKVPSEFAIQAIKLMKDNSYYLEILGKLQEFKKNYTWLDYVSKLISELSDRSD